MKIDITGLNYDEIDAYVCSRYFGHTTAAERMASASDSAVDPFAAIEKVRDDLDNFLAGLPDGLKRGELLIKLIEVIERND
jgi:hypothetical protein